MPCLIDVADEAACSLGDCAAALDAVPFDPVDPESLSHAALWLRRLGNNRDFLGDVLVESLSARHRDEPAQAYGPQVIMLTAPGSSSFLRCAIWPGAGEGVLGASGQESFVYGLPHDHNFSFLTHGYFGPGYWSEFYEYDYDGVTGWAGEAAHLRPMGRHRLESDRIMLYRAHRDVHLQLPADALSVSVNVMHAVPAIRWLDQYTFDVERGTIAANVDCGPSESFLRLAVALGGDEALDLAEHFARRHPSDRLRVTAWDSLAARETDLARRDAIWAVAEGSGSRMVEMEARARRGVIAVPA
ncbi:transposase [Novosphingobium bradum]|uniref:Transposase n=1 Tax=Novosphingobium bradum TaxID=1737444 RepID=A0ABV7INI7_9SPHN